MSSTNEVLGFEQEGGSRFRENKGQRGKQEENQTASCAKFSLVTSTPLIHAHFHSTPGASPGGAQSHDALIKKSHDDLTEKRQRKGMKKEKRAGQ